MKKYVLYATPLGEPEWKEVIITDTEDKQHLEKARSWAEGHGFNRFRIYEYDSEVFEKPDFTKAINV